MGSWSTCEHFFVVVRFIPYYRYLVERLQPCQGVHFPFHVSSSRNLARADTHSSPGEYLQERSRSSHQSTTERPARPVAGHFTFRPATGHRNCATEIRDPFQVLLDYR